MTEVATQLSEQELCPDALLTGQEAAFARDIARLQARQDEFVSVACPACAHDDAPPLFLKYGFQYRQCPRCATIFMSPRPSPAVMAGYYLQSENYQYWAKYIFPASEAARREKINRPWLQQIVNLCSRFAVNRTHLVEVGPGFGTFAALATTERAFESVTAIEPTPEMAQACRDRGVRVVELGIEAVVDQVEPADVVVAFEVVEHLFAPVGFFEQARRLLKTGGILVVSCPNGLGFDIATLGPESLAVDAEHVNLLNPSSICQLGQRCGFQCLEVTTPGRLDAEFVRTAALAGRYDLTDQPFLRRVLLDEWETLGWPFQQFLAANGLSAHMWGVFRKAGH